MPTSRWRMPPSRTSSTESCRAAGEATHHPGARHRAPPAGAAGVSRGEAVASGVLPASTVRSRARCRGDRCAERPCGGTRPLGLLEALRSAPCARAGVESQACAPRVLRVAVEPAAPHREARAEAGAAALEERPHDSLGRVPPLTFLPRPQPVAQSPIGVSA